MQSFRVPVRWILGAALGATVFLNGCDDEETTIFVPEPVITAAISASEDSTASGGVVTLVATAETSGDAPLSFSWSADQGSFSTTTEDTTRWTAPESPGIYEVSVVVTDGQNVAIATHTLGVETYVPAVTPFYRGAAYCQGCHSNGVGGDQYASWANSAHARAWETLEEIGQERNPNCLQCHTVGSQGLNADPAIDNGGYDETAVPRLYGVQCENCHGPGSAHPQDFASVQVTMDAMLCGDCHNGPHHPTFDEWATSGHSGVVEEPAGRTTCAKCHNGAYAGTYLDDPAGFSNPAAVDAVLPITCAVCHDPHGNDNPGNLRQASVTDVVLPDGTVIPEAGAGRLCMSCHNGRRTPENIEDQIENGSGHLGPHGSNQGDMLAGTGAYEALAPSFPFTSSRHLAVRDGCVHCHTHPHEGDIAFTGHTFEPTVESCEECHGVITDFDQILAKEDFDGDLAIEGVQHEVEGLMTLLQAAIIDASVSPEDSLALEQDFHAAIGDTNVSTRRQREAGYNLIFVENDKSHGVHNTTYTVQLLQQSILAVNAPRMPHSAFILRE
jgi:hypothetical protein